MTTSTTKTFAIPVNCTVRTAESVSGCAYGKVYRRNGRMLEVQYEAGGEFFLRWVDEGEVYVPGGLPRPWEM